MTAIKVNLDETVDFMVELLNIPSPTGFTQEAITFVERSFASLPLPSRRNNKGALIATVEGETATQPRALTAHVDTLGAMIAEIQKHGYLKLTQIGGYTWNSVEGESVTIHTADGRRFRGTILASKASVHAYGRESAEQERKTKNMVLRLDARAEEIEDVRDLGIEVGDFVSFDPRVEATSTGFVRSRHLDDKAGVACVYGALKTLSDAGLQPAQRTTIHISNYEEHGHGAATGFPADLVDLLAVDMAVLGPQQNSDEYSVAVCAKDSGGPYHLDLRRHLVSLAQEAGIPYKVDVYPYYGSDGTAFWRAGGDVRVGLIGPGVDASHAYERTHRDSLEATIRLIVEFLLH